MFWFYAAKDRYLTLDEVVDVGAGGLAQVEDAVRNFSTLAGPIINGYAFCDIANQQAIRAKALDWVEQNPYEAIFMERLPPRRSDRTAGAARRGRADAGERRQGTRLSAGCGERREISRRPRAQRHGREILLEVLSRLARSTALDGQGLRMPSSDRNVPLRGS